MQRRDLLKLGAASALLGLAPAAALALPAGRRLGLSTFPGERRLVLGPVDLALSAYGQSAILVRPDGVRIALAGASAPGPWLRRYVAATLSPDHSVWLLDAGQQRLERYALNGNKLGEEALPASPGWSALASDQQGRLWAADALKQRLWVREDRRWRALDLARGLAAGELNGPTALAFDRDGQVHVLNRGNRRVDVYGETGRHLASYGDARRSASALAMTERDEVLVLDSAGAWIHGYHQGRTLLQSDLGLTTPWRSLAYRPDRGLYLCV